MYKCTVFFNKNDCLTFFSKLLKVLVSSIPLVDNMFNRERNTTLTYSINKIHVMFFKKECENLLSPSVYDSVQIGEAFFSLHPLQLASCLFIIVQFLGGTALSNQYSFKLLSHVIQILLLHKQKLMRAQRSNRSQCKK